MDNIHKDFQKNKEIVVDLLVKNVLSVNIEIPKVVKGAFWVKSSKYREIQAAFCIVASAWRFSNLINTQMIFINNKYVKHIFCPLKASNALIC